MIDKTKIERTVKIYPLFYGLTSDLIFWVAINTLFLTTVKHLSPSQINSISAIATAIGIVFQLFLIKIVRKIGNLNSVRVGTVLLFMAAMLDTICVSYFGLLVAEICYAIGFVFKHMDSVIIIRNLNYLKREEDYIKIQNQGSIIYSSVTLVICIISGFLFNINPYLPMIICTVICFINILLTFLFYEAPLGLSESEAKVENVDKNSLNRNVILMIILYGAFYALVAISQKNSKLFIQLNLEEFLSLDKVSIYMSVIIAISRVVRLTANLIFLKVYKKLENKMIFLFEILLALSFILLLLGNFVGKNMIGICIMVAGFFVYLGIRDSFDNYMRKIMFDSTKEEIHDKVINYFNLSRKISDLVYGIIISLMLMKLSYPYVMAMLLAIALPFTLIIVDIYKEVNKGS